VQTRAKAGSGFSFAVSKSRKRKSPTKDQKRFGYFCAPKVTGEIAGNLSRYNISGRYLFHNLNNKSITLGITENLMFDLIN
jgi:hypothetical protein